MVTTAGVTPAASTPTAMTTETCPNGWGDQLTCTHPMCPVHKDENTRKKNAQEWADLIKEMQS